MATAPIHLTANDYQAIEFLDWRAMWFDYIGDKHQTMPPEVHQLTYERIRDSSTSLRGFVASAAKPMGFVHYYFHPSSYNVKEACTIEDLYVSPAARGTGVGRWMIEQVAQIAREAGAPALHWKTSQANVPAITLYRKLATQADVHSFTLPL